jgi:seryl-tRNA synthetase
VLDIKWIRENPAALDAALAKRGKPPVANELLALDEKHRALLTEIQTLQNERNTVAKAYGDAKRQGQSAEDLGQRANDIKQALQSLETDSTQIQHDFDYLLAITPNIPREEVPKGKDEADNITLKTWGDIPTFSFDPKRHFDLGEALGLMDFETAAKMSGARFVILRGALGKLYVGSSHWYLWLRRNSTSSLGERRSLLRCWVITKICR